MTNEPMNQKDLENLILHHFDGALTEEQETELAEELATSAEAKQLFLSYMRMEGRLHSVGRDGFLSEPAPDPDKFAPQPTVVAPIVHVDQQPSSFLRSRLFVASTSLAVSVAVILMLSFGVLRPSPASASSVLQKARQAAAKLVDRAYRVTRSRTGEHSSLREFRFDVRGGGRFVLRPADGAFVVGSDGTDYWLTQPDGPVWVTSHPQRLRPELIRTLQTKWLFGIAINPDEPLLMGMAGFLSYMELTRDLELIDSPNASEHHIRATLRTAKGDSPERIDLWTDVDSGVGLRAEVRWVDGRLVRFELIESGTVSDRWYHYSQHAPNREVKRPESAQ